MNEWSAYVTQETHCASSSGPVFHLSPESPPQYHVLCPDSSEVHIE